MPQACQAVNVRGPGQFHGHGLRGLGREHGLKLPGLMHAGQQRWGQHQALAQHLARARLVAHQEGPHIALDKGAHFPLRTIERTQAGQGAQSVERRQHLGRPALLEMVAGRLQDHVPGQAQRLLQEWPDDGLLGGLGRAVCRTCCTISQACRTGWVGS